MSGTHSVLSVVKVLDRPSKVHEAILKGMTRIFATADIGSNTAHLLIAATDGELVMRVDNFNEWIPLGEMVAKKGLIPDENVDQLVLSMKEFRSMSKARKAESLYVFATEAMRSASNHEEVIDRIRLEAGIPVDIISPVRETELSFRGIGLDQPRNEIDLMFEVGGGSAQVASIAAGKIQQQISLPLGTGRLIAQVGLVNPPTPEMLNSAEINIQKCLAESNLPSCPVKARAVASGGVARGLWRALHPDGEKILHRSELEYLVWSASRLSVDRIINRFSVKAKRAGTLLPGALVYRALMDRFKLTEIQISEFGVREGAVLELARGKIDRCPV